MMLMASCDIDGSVNGIKLAKSLLELDCDCHDLRNTMMPLTTLTATHHSRAGPNGVT